MGLVYMQKTIFQFVDHVQGSQVAILPFIDLKEEESEEEFDCDPQSRDCFVDFAQLPAPSAQLTP